MGAAAARARQEGEQQQGEERAHDSAVYILSHAGGDWELDDPGFGAAGPVMDCSIGYQTCDHHHFAFHLHRSSTLFRAGQIEEWNPDDAEDSYMFESEELTPPFPTTLPGEIIAVGAGAEVGAAVCRDGRVHSWGLDKYIGRNGDGVVPAAVSGLPPVALLAVGTDATVTISAEDEAHGWGNIRCDIHSVVSAPMRIAALSGRHICRIAVGNCGGAAETRLGELVTFGFGALHRVRHVTEVAVRFPLRSLVCGTNSGVWVADAVGAVWFSASYNWFNAVDLPQRQRPVRLAAHETGVVALTEKGELFMTKGHSGTWDAARAVAPALPRGVIPFGGPTSKMVVLLPDRCGGKQRLHVFARIAARLRLPCDPVRAVLVNFVVNDVYLVGSEWEPFS
eukprot:TRINITY_DN11760_c0_g1_i1.p1 TRINITY_DN11760_c0_g1~~TRINITY_DN11760_c0_g1_i1.p1  ORF type:complete len:394 (+),score=86.09 TRINITY_DN11760_c0_g1_i1:75-1256(+)